LRHDAGGAPAYQYLFQWQTPILDGIPGAWHTAELAFCFDNTKICDQATGNTPEAQAIARKMAGAWAAFAHTGRPDQPGLAWGPSDPAHCQTMVFDTQCRMENDPEGAVRRILLGTLAVKQKPVQEYQATERVDKSLRIHGSIARDLGIAIVTGHYPPGHIL
ncbi:hypothetical protein KXV85_004374, partial [Aspergillus fumigatus]